MIGTGARLAATGWQYDVKNDPRQRKSVVGPEDDVLLFALPVPEEGQRRADDHHCGVRTPQAVSMRAVVAAGDKKETEKMRHSRQHHRLQHGAARWPFQGRRSLRWVVIGCHGAAAVLPVISHISRLTRS